MELFVEEKYTCGQMLGRKTNISQPDGDRKLDSPGWKVAGKVAGCMALGLVAWGIQGCERKSSGVRTVELLKQVERAHEAELTNGC